MGYVDENGWVRLDGMKKELIRARGFQASPTEIEDIVRSRPGVADIAVVGVDDAGRSGDVPRAFFVRLSGKEITEEKVKT